MNNLLRKVTKLLLGLSLAAGVGVAIGSKAEAKSAEAADQVYYTLTPSTGSNNSYAGNCDVAISGITWNVTGNASMTPWRLGGKSISNTDRAVYSKTAMGAAITKVELTVGAASSITVNSLKLIVGSNSNYSTTIDTVTKTFAANSTITFTPTSGTSWATSSFYKFNFNVTVSGTSNKFVEFSSAKFYYAPAATYTVSFNANGGSGTMSSVSNVTGSYTLPACTFTAPANKAFSGWKADNAGDLIAAGGSYNVGANVTFYAQWVDAYIVTYSAGTNGSGSYAHTNRPSGTYTLLSFESLTGVSANSGYKFDNYTVGGVDKNPGDTITLSAATTITVNFKVKPIETTYVFATNYSAYASSWSTTYGEQTVNGKTGVGGDYDATIDFKRVNKQSSGVGSNKPYLCGNTNSDALNLVFTLNESGYKIEDVIMTFEQRGSNAPVVKLFKGNSGSGTALDTATIGTKNTLSTSSSLNDTSFSMTINAGGTSNKGVALTSIYISLAAQASFGDLDHIKITSYPTTVYHVGESFDSTGFEVFAYDDADESTASFKDVTASVVTDFDGGYTFTDSDVPGFDCEVSYTGDNGSDTVSFHVDVYALAQYELVTSELTDWSGEYLIVGTKSDELYAMNGSLSPLDVEGNHKAVTEDSNNVIETGQELEFVIASYSTGYSIKTKTNKYFGWSSSSNNGLTESDSALVNTLSYSDGAVTIAGSGGRHLSFNTDGAGRFRYYTSGSVQLYRLVESSNAISYAETFLAAFTCDASGESAPTFTIKEGSTYWSWSLLATEYNTLTAVEKEEFRLGVASESGDEIAQALARYDYVVGKYGTATYSDFMSRNPAQIGLVKLALGAINENTHTIAAIVVISLVSVTAIGGYFFIKRRQEN